MSRCICKCIRIYIHVHVSYALPRGTWLSPFNLCKYMQFGSRSERPDLDPSAFPSNFGQNWEKMINLTSKLREINDIEHNRGVAKYIFKIKVFWIVLCIMPSIPLKQKCLNIIMIWVVVSHI